MKENPYDILRPRARPRWRLFWAGASLLALLVLAAQLAWFNRDRLLLDYPQWLPYAQQICHRLNCSITRQHNARAIRLVQRDVRPHPRYEDTLLVQATLLNELAMPQPYPRVQLALFDTAGKLLGHRHFVPADYLPGGADPDQGMPVNQPVRFALAINGPNTAVVSFEFRLW